MDARHAYMQAVRIAAYAAAKRDTPEAVAAYERKAQAETRG